MMNSQRVVAMTVLLGLAASAAAQTPPKEPPPLWDVQVGAAFVGTSGNFVFNPSSATTERVTFYPDFRDSSAYRAEAEATAQAALNARLALRLGYLWRYSHAPIAGFVNSDNTATASVVVRWRAATTIAPAP